MNFSATAVGEDGEADEAAEEVFAIACKEVTRDWQGFGNDVKMKAKRPEYRGGQHFGQDDDSDSDVESGDDEGAETLAAQGLSLADPRSGVFDPKSTISNPAPDSALSS